MLTLPPSVRIYVAAEPVDMRRGHDGLAAIVRGQWQMELFDGHLFVFLGRRSDRVKILFWDRGGFVLYYKRLERGRFRLPRIEAGEKTMQLGAGELAMLLDGIDIASVKQPKRWLPRSARANAA
jgi:transposase